MTMTFINEQAREEAENVLAARRAEIVRDKVAGAVTHLTTLVEDCSDGTILTFHKYDPTTKQRYHYAVIRSNAKWYSTGSKTGINGATSDQLIAWLVSLDMYSLDDLDLFLQNSDDTEIEVEKVK
jgi:hypothetical protein